ncbi:hypothetical protein PS676_05864 [Pseudomonas fluorescens]|nr:hypothetical protein PS676_05864 [Pseudomonas fluorescens]
MYYRCLSGFIIVNSDQKHILFVLYAVVITTVLISNIVVDTIKASRFHYLQSSSPLNITHKMGWIYLFDS